MSNHHYEQTVFLLLLMAKNFSALLTLHKQFFVLFMMQS